MMPFEVLGAALRRVSTPNGAAVVTALCVLSFGVATLSRYGITVDAPALFYSGDRTLFALTHPHVAGALDLLSHGEPTGFVPRFARYPDWHDPVHYPVAVDLACAVTSYIFHDSWKLMDVVDGHHLGLVLVYALTAGFYALYTSRLLGSLGGAGATLALVLYPSAMGHSFNNAKDWPCAMFYALTVLAFGLGFIERRERDVLAAGVWLGMALSAKLNGTFALVTIAAFAVVGYVLVLDSQERAATRRLGRCALLVPCIGVGMFVALWPWLYEGGGAQIAPRVHDYLGHFYGQGVTDRPYFWAYPFRCVFWMTPPVTLFAGGVFAACGWCGSRRDRVLWWLLVLWFVIPLLRIAMPRANVYDANRHFIEYVPALCAMAGAGIATIVDTARARASERSQRLRLRIAGLTAALAAIAASMWPIIEYYPYESGYYNALAGGLGAAQHEALSRAPRSMPWPDWVTAGCEGDFWFSSLRDAMRDVAALANPRAVLGTCGPYPPQARANLPPASEVTVVPWDDEAATVVYVSPRETICTWKTIRELESTRRILRRVERDGGLVYELFGERLPSRVAPLSSDNWYTRNL